MSWWKALTAKSLRDFERAVICPLHGYASEEEYYAANCPRIENLNRVKVPTLVILSEDDPIVDLYSQQAALAGSEPAITVRVTRHGGHIAYGKQWSDRTAAAFFHRHRAKPRL
jgi:predicted alpha/beta-fold hydrolase